MPVHGCCVTRAFVWRSLALIARVMLLPACSASSYAQSRLDGSVAVSDSTSLGGTDRSDIIVFHQPPDVFVFSTTATTRAPKRQLIPWGSTTTLTTCLTSALGLHIGS
ncbi:hypothetical protein EDB85DRAFT_882379 [Lactarius pseudohatsudake]|nr:hypothetical protein EDB85DRAFT_882379 [Lactarius pseudohatsudake]